MLPGTRGQWGLVDNIPKLGTPIQPPLTAKAKQCGMWVLGGKRTWKTAFGPPAPGH